MSSRSDSKASDLPRKSWWQRQRQPNETNLRKNLDKQFSGKKGWGWEGVYYRPRRLDHENQDHMALGDNDYGGSLSKDVTGKFKYTNQLGQTSTKYSDVAVYLSPTTSAPRRLVVQATDGVLRRDRGTGDWRRTKIKGDVPTILVLSEWALRPFGHKSWYRRIDGCLRLLIVSIPVQILAAIPGAQSWDDGDTIDTYMDFPGYHWQWAKHAINPLDAKPQSAMAGTVARRADNLVPSSRQRLLRPRQLVVKQPDETWTVQEPGKICPPYIFVSFADKAFSSPSGRQLIQRMAARAAIEAGCQAYWLDFLCRAPEAGDLLDSDVYRMCDVIRGSVRVVVMLPDDRIESRVKWGSRMWTLPEALLAPGHELSFCRLHEDKLTTETLTLIQMTADVWQDEIDADEDGGPTRLLAEHFANLLTLSRLELFSLALRALWRRSLDDYKFFTRSDVVYALMGLLHYRIERDDSDTEFQSLAQLSLRNDSDRIVERMISLYPGSEPNTLNPFFTLASTDQFHTHLWDIDPTCQVVGVAYEDNTVLVDSCRAIHIRWKNFPRPVMMRDTGFLRLLAMVVVAATTWWLVNGISLAIYYAPLFNSNLEDSTRTALQWLVAGFLFVAILLACFGPSAVRRLYRGQVLQSTSNLVGFEGVMPLDQLERLVFGQCSGRLSYEASSTPYAENHRDELRRVGLEPPWVATAEFNTAAAPIPQGHRLFTLVDTGELTVSIFSAERPPTVALLCGREGGMLRAVLCSWQFENDCLYKEAVLRMPTNIWDSAKPKGWLKLCLRTLNQAREIERAEKLRRATPEST